MNLKNLKLKAIEMLLMEFLLPITIRRMKKKTLNYRDCNDVVFASRLSEKKSFFHHNDFHRHTIEATSLIFPFY